MVQTATQSRASIERPQIRYLRLPIVFSCAFFAFVLSVVSARNRYNDCRHFTRVDRKSAVSLATERGDYFEVELGRICFDHVGVFSPATKERFFLLRFGVCLLLSSAAGAFKI